MQYGKASIKEIVGRVIRNTKLQNSSEYKNLHIWIAEACADMQTKWSLAQVWMDKEIRFHDVDTPCGMKILSAVEYNGYRLAQRNVARQAALTPRVEYNKETGVWVSSIEKKESPGGYTTYVQSQVNIPVTTLDSHWYQENGPGKIMTSIADGMVRFHYKEVPHDEFGFPLIPDVYSFKEACYWYCRTKLIESGWEDPVLNWEVCNTRYETFRRGALADLSFPSTDRIEEMADMVSLIPTQNYWDSFANFYLPGPGKDPNAYVVSTTPETIIYTGGTP
jgi:hypothetical protein